MQLNFVANSFFSNVNIKCSNLNKNKFFALFFLFLNFLRVDKPYSSLLVRVAFFDLILIICGFFLHL